MRAYEDSRERPYIHLVDGGVADNLAMRGVLDVLDEFAALRFVGHPSLLDHLKRIVVIVVNSLSTPATNWDKEVDQPGTFAALMQATGVPIDHYSYAAIEELKDTAAGWKMLRGIRDSGAIVDKGNPALRDVMRVPDAEVYVIPVSFDELKDAKERAFLNQLPTSFVLSDEAVDRLRSAAGTILFDAPEFRRFLTDVGGRIADGPVGAGMPMTAH
jgi:NTE family protein